MTAAAATMPGMSKKRPNASQEGGKPEKPEKPGRRPSVVLFARVDPALGNAFNDHVQSIRPKTTTQAVLELLIEQYLEGLGLWPPPKQPDQPAG